MPFWNGFVSCLRFPCLPLYQISPPKPQVTTLLLANGQAKGKRMGWRQAPLRPPALLEKNEVGPVQLVRFSALLAQLGRKGLVCDSCSIVVSGVCPAPPGAQIGSGSPCSATSSLGNLAGAVGGMGAWLPILHQKDTDDFQVLSSKQRGREQKRRKKQS